MNSILLYGYCNLNAQRVRIPDYNSTEKKRINSGVLIQYTNLNELTKWTKKNK